MNTTLQHAVPSPSHIAIGLGQATRQEICGLLAMQEAAKIARFAASLGDAARRKLASDDRPAVDRVALLAQELMDGQIPTDALRARLWLIIKEALGLPGLYPLSSRELGMEATAVAVRASEVLTPALVSARQKKEDAGLHVAGKLGRSVRRAVSGVRGRAKAAVTFPDIVASELAAVMENLAHADRRGELDPEVAAAIRKGQQAISAAALAGGSWGALATAIGAAGFAPYISAAKLSAVIPFVAGPTLTSLLAVMINPVTVVAGTAALGYWAVKGQGAAARQVAGARAAILLAVRGQAPGDGMAELVAAFRSLHRMTPQELCHLTAAQRSILLDQAATVKASLATEIPPPTSAAPGLWGVPLDMPSEPARQDVALVAGLTAGDMLYHAAAVDPAILAAADFSRVLMIETPLDLATHVSTFAAQGAQIALRGYSAEQLVMATLVEEGHAVALAQGATTPGYDLIVDGVPVQVKCGSSISLLHDHFAKYPDIPVIADNALAADAQTAGEAWAPLVTTVAGFELEHVQALVDRSLEAAAGVGEISVPAYAAIVSGARAAHKAWTGQIPVEDLPAWLILDLSIRGGLATAGQTGGALLGLLVIGPAGALILGPLTGVLALLGTGKAHDLLDRGIRSEWHAAVLHAAEQLQKEMLKAWSRQVEALTRLLARLRAEGRDIPRPLLKWIESRTADDLIAAIEAQDRLPMAISLRDAMELLIQASTPGMIDPDVLRARRNLALLIKEKPSTTGAMKKLGGDAHGILRKRFGEKQ